MAVQNKTSEFMNYRNQHHMHDVELGIVNIKSDQIPMLWEEHYRRAKIILDQLSEKSKILEKMISDYRKDIFNTFKLGINIDKLVTEIDEMYIACDNELKKSASLDDYKNITSKTKRKNVTKDEILPVRIEMLKMQKEISTRRTVLAHCATRLYTEKLKYKKLVRAYQELKLERENEEKNYNNYSPFSLTPLSQYQTFYDTTTPILLPDTERSDDQSYQLEQMHSTYDTSRHLASERDASIIKLADEINQISELIKSLHSLVIDQGSIVDRIDYNIESTLSNVKIGNLHLEKAEKYSRSSKSIICICVLILLILALVIILIYKNTK